MTNQEAIQEAYGKHWETVKNYVDKKGWCKSYWGIQFEELDGIVKPKSEGTRWRPKSLQGIENNNGWIKIKTKSDLPKTRDKDDVFILDCDGRIVVGCTMLLSDKEIRNFWLATVTHYKPIVKPQLPIY